MWLSLSKPACRSRHPEPVSGSLYKVVRRIRKDTFPILQPPVPLSATLQSGFEMNAAAHLLNQNILSHPNSLLVMSYQILNHRIGNVATVNFICRIVKNNSDLPRTFIFKCILDKKYQLL